MEKVAGQVQATASRLASKAEAKYKRMPTVLEQLSTGLGKEGRPHLASNLWFNLVICLFIILSSVLVGVEMDRAVGNGAQDRLGFLIADFFFAVVFFGEMLVRQNLHGWDYFLDPWNAFDYGVVVINCADIVASVYPAQAEATGLRLASTLRVLRLMRVVRQIKGIRMLSGLWLILQGLLASLKTMAWTGLFLLIIVFCFAIALVTIVGQDAALAEHFERADVYTGSVGRAMLTIIQVFTLDSWADLGRSFLNAGSPAALALFILAIIICHFGVLNIIVAVMVERVAEMSKEAKMKGYRLMEKVEVDLMVALGRDFGYCDEDRSGALDLQEFLRLVEMDSVKGKLLLLGFRIDEAVEFFALLDADESGSVSPAEFVEGLQRFRGEAGGEVLLELICLVGQQASRAKKSVARVRALSAQADVIQARLNVLGRGMSAELEGRGAACVRADHVHQQAVERQQVIGHMDWDRQVGFPSLRPTGATP